MCNFNRKFIHFHSGTCISKCRLPNGCHLVSVSMFWDSFQGLQQLAFKQLASFDWLILAGWLMHAQTVNTETTCTWAAPWARAKHHWKINKHLTLFFTENTRRSDMLRLRNVWQLLYGNETNNWWVAKLNPRKYVLFFWSPNSGRQITKCQAPCGDTTEWSVVFAAHSDSLSWTGRYCWW